MRATAFVPWINGLRTAVEIDGERYMDWATLGRNIEIGRRDMSETVEKISGTSESLVHGVRAAEITNILE